ncbi:MAG: M3 family oligoendopeptidase [Marine Group III euryarchaeote CG-Epi6]|uniref:M3 family oligoendopeptidase n=1 Tax=Marine Group III euryarchaeote CG-Epi6 TaxID=1889000 RepID=A0A1J5T8Q2_9ARCH|nr:MAG: M3 family oligoendopeptidase [Marine Group III euryarchaeote CG-Epi6]
MNHVLPKDSTQMRDWSWDQYVPFFDHLETFDLNPANISNWMKYWSDLSELVGEVGTSVYVSTTVDTTDEEAKERYHKFLEDISENVSSRNQKLKIKFLDSGLSPDDFEIPLRGIKSEVNLFSKDNLPLLTSDAKLSKEYDAIIGSQTVKWEDEEITLTQLSPIMLETNRDRREKAWKLASTRRLQDRNSINKIWKKVLRIRMSIADNSGYDDYRAWRWEYLKRFDYTPEDCLTFHESIEKVIVPLANKLLEKRKVALGLDKLKPWDLSVDIFGRDALVPFENADELEDKCHNIFNSVDLELGKHFAIMREKELLDLGNRKGKAPGGYCTEYPFQRLPFIFMNAVGTHSDVQTMIHEGGHAFHVFESADLPYSSQRDVGMEFAEVASMAMELLASPFLAEKDGGFYSDEDSARARIEHLEKVIMFWPYMAVVDAFQHWAYTNPDEALKSDNCDAEWTALWERFQMSEHIDYSGCEDIIATGWHNKLHIYHVPFYYVEYGMAQLGAIQIWGKSLKDAKKAIGDYRAALSLGGNATLPQLYEAAGARFSFDDKTLEYAANLIEEQIKDLS